jgi:hypothetical protein
MPGNPDAADLTRTNLTPHAPDNKSAFSVRDARPQSIARFLPSVAN